MPDNSNMNRNEGNGAPEIRGPKIPRGLPTLIGFIVIAFVLISVWNLSTRVVRDMSLAEFQKFWDNDAKVYRHFGKAEMSEETLLLYPENQVWAEEFARDQKKMITPPTTTAASPAPSNAANPAEKSNQSVPAKSEPGKQAELAKELPAKPTPTTAKAAEPEKKSAEVKADNSGKPAAEKSPSEMWNPKREFWFRVRVPQRALDAEFTKQLATIPNFRYEPVANQFPWITQLLFLTLLFAGLWFVISFLLRNQAGPGNVLAFGRSRTRAFIKENTRIRFNDVAGIDEAKEDVMEVIEFLKDPRRFERLGGRIPRGILFVGPPGTGKTLLAKAIAGEAGVPFFGISGSDFVEMFVGVGASRVRDLFRQARENSPCIIFLDEIDAVGRRRGGGHGNSHEEREQTLNAILVEMDGFDTNEQVIVIAATNRSDVLDPALLRPGRFDREVYINLPDVKGRFEILKVHGKKVKLGAEVDLMKIARGTPMFSGAQLMALMNEAAIRATLLGKEVVEESDLEEARDKVRYGREHRSRELDEHDRKVTAYHEAGHAILLLRLPDAEPLHKVTIIPRGNYLGAAFWLPEKDRYTKSKKRYLADIRVAFGGRIAEELFFDEITSGASSDIKSATETARRMICELGMSAKLGPVRYSNREQQAYLGGEYVGEREISEDTARVIDEEVRALIEQCYVEAKEVIEQNKADLELLAEALLLHETLNTEEIAKLFETRQISSIVKPEAGPFLPLTEEKNAQANASAT